MNSPLLEQTYDYPSAIGPVIRGPVWDVVHERSPGVASARILPLAIFLLHQGPEHLVVLELVPGHNQVDPP